MSDLVCFPMRAEWDRLQPTVVDPFPQPLVSSRDGQQDAHPHPGPVDDLMAYARAQGWECQLQYAEGWVPHGATGKPIGPKVSWAIRMQRGEYRAVAMRLADTWDTLWTVSPDRFHKHPTLTAFKKAMALVP